MIITMIIIIIKIIMTMKNENDYEKMIRIIKRMQIKKKKMP